MLSDLRSAIRQLRRNPGFGAATVLTLALGIGSTSAVFTLADPMLFRPLPYPDMDRLVVARVTGPGTFGLLQIADYLRAEQQHRGFQSIGAFSVSVSGPVADLPDRVLAYSITPGLLDVLAVRPAMGRAFLPEEYHAPPAMPDVCIITHGLWQRAFGGQNDVLNRTLQLGGSQPRSFRIVGVLPAAFVLPDHVNRAPEFFLPGLPDTTDEGNPNRGSGLYARLKPGVTIEAARTELQAIVTSVERDFTKIPRGRIVFLDPLQTALFGRMWTPLLTLLLATACVLLLGCANLAHLFSAHLHARRRELGIRIALGASRWRVTRQLIVEASVLALFGGAAALLVAMWVFEIIMARTPEFAHVYRLLPAGVDARVVAFSAVLGATAVLLYGWIPAIWFTGRDVRTSVQPGAADVGSRVSGPMLIVVQTAVAVTLVVTSALLVRSFTNLAFQPLGYDPHGRRSITAEFAPQDARSDPERVRHLQRRLYAVLTDRMTVPVTAYAALPGMHIPGPATVPGRPPGPPYVVAYPVAGTFFDVFGLSLLRGRLFSDDEAFANAPVAVVDQRVAETFWPGEDPLGKTVQDSSTIGRTVVGVVATLQTSLRASAADHGGSVFVPFRPQDSLTLAFRPGRSDISFDAVRTLVREVVPDADVFVRAIEPFERTLGQPRFLATLIGALGLITIALSMVGVFGVVNHQVVGRTREIGIRLSLGAGRTRIMRLVLRRVMLPALAGLVVGALPSLWWTRGFRALLFGLGPNDPSTFALTGALVLAAVACASLPAALRAARVDPTVALRAE